MARVVVVVVDVVVVEAHSSHIRAHTRTNTFIFASENEWHTRTNAHRQTRSQRESTTGARMRKRLSNTKSSRTVACSLPHCTFVARSHVAKDDAGAGYGSYAAVLICLSEANDAQSRPQIAAQVKARALVTTSPDGLSASSRVLPSESRALRLCACLRTCRNCACGRASEQAS